MSDEAPLGPDELNLAVLASRHAPDPLLAELAQRADIGAGFGVAVLINGMIVMGSLAQPEHMADVIDAQWRTAMSRSERPDDVWEEDWEAMYQRISTQASKVQKDRREELAELEDEAKPYKEPGGLDPSAIPASLTRRAIVANAYSHLTIRDARISAPGQAGVTVVDALRVAIDQIAGWWILRADEDGHSVTTLWQTDGGS